MRLILIGNDIKNIAQTEMLLLKEEYVVDCVSTTYGAELALRTTNYDLIVLDFSLSRDHSVNLLKKYRSRGGDVPILVLTEDCTRDERVNLLNSGADDCLAKPFYVDEMLARVRVLLRRRVGQKKVWMEHGKMRVNFSSHQVTLANVPVHLTRLEFSILRVLLISEGRIVSTREIENKIYRPGEEVESNTINVYISHLRKKFGTNMIKNVRGVGFMIESKVLMEGNNYN